MAITDDFDPRRILVVDSDLPMLSTHGRVLEAHGFRPVLMEDPADALDEAIERTPAVLVMDLVMPGMSGVELVARLRHHLGRATPPVVLVSADLLALSPLEQLTFDALFAKPYAIDTMVGWVRRLARQHYERRRAPSEVVLRRGAAIPDEEEA